MDLFSRTMLASSAEAGLSTTDLGRHVPLLRRNVRSGDRVTLLSGCVGSDGRAGGECVLMLTTERLTVTRQSRMLGLIRVCLDAPLRAVEHLRWSADPSGPGVELGFTVADTPGATGARRWHFWLPASHAKRVWRIDAVLAREFRRPLATDHHVLGAGTLPRSMAAARSDFEQTLAAVLGPELGGAAFD